MVTVKRFIGTVGLLSATLAVLGAAAPAAAAAATTGAARTADARAVAAVPRCTTNRLAITEGREDGAAGTLYLQILFTNTSSRSCVISGYPRVVYVATPTGPEVNDPAGPWSTDTPPVLVLTPGATADATLGMPQPYYDEDVCRPVYVDGIRVAPPGSRASVFLSLPKLVCSASGVGTPYVQAVDWPEP